MENKLPKEIKKYVGLLDSQKGTLQTLESWQKQAIMLHLEGLPATQISEQLHKSPQTIRKLLDSPTAQELIQEYYSFLDGECKALYSGAIDALRDCLSPNAPIETRRRAAEFVLQGKMQQTGTSKEEDSAEGIIQRVLNQYVYIDQRNNSETQESLEEATKHLPKGDDYGRQD